MTSSDLEGMSLKELRALAAIKGVLRPAKLTKGELVAALSAGQAPAASAARATAKPSTDVHQRRRKQATFTATAKPDLAGPSSSGLRPALPAKPLPPPAALPASDPGLPVPPRYGHDRLVLMVQDPQHIFAYWEISGETLSQVQARISGQAMPVLIVHTGSGHEFREVDLRGGNYYLAVAPAGQYEAELALRDAHGQLHPLARSNKVATPAPSVSSRVDEQWMGIDENFHELLELAGLPGQPHPVSSASRLADQRLTAWNWERVAGLGSIGSSPSSHSLSSRELVAPR
jgi:hypothetical protein